MTDDDDDDGDEVYYTRIFSFLSQIYYATNSLPYKWNGIFRQQRRQRQAGTGIGQWTERRKKFPEEVRRKREFEKRQRFISTDVLSTLPIPHIVPFGCVCVSGAVKSDQCDDKFCVRLQQQEQQQQVPRTVNVN